MEIIEDYGQSFEIEQCSVCGGFWFDKDELYRVPTLIGQKIDTPEAIKPYSGSLKCPHDETILVEFKDPNLPPNLTMYRCPDCRGIFLAKGQLFAYKEYQKERTLKSIEFSRKTAIGLSVFLGISLLGYIWTLFLENAAKADPLAYADYGPVLGGFRNVFLLLSVLVSLFLVIAFVSLYWRKRKK